MEVLTSLAQAAIDPQIQRRNDAANRARVDVRPTDGARHFTLHINHAFKVAKGERVLPLHYIAEEPFEMIIDEGVITLQHEQWSLRGEGKTLLEAERNLLDFAVAIAPAYVHHPHHKLTKRAQALRDFFLKVI